MFEREMSEKNKILVIRTGSHLYGTNTPESDEDEIGVFIPDKEYILGMQKVEEVDFSEQIKDKNGKNTKDSKDYKLYSLQKFVKLSMENNPNILEMLFVNDKNILFINDFGKQLLENRHLFPHRGSKHKFLGYAFSQKHKMVMRSENYNFLKESYDYLSKQNPDKFIIGFKLEGDEFFEGKFTKDFLKIGDLNIQLNIHVKKALKQLKQRIDTFSNRGELISKYGYDTKFGMHLIRLMMEGEELLQTGKLEFPSPNREMLLDVRNGKYPVEEIIKISEEYEGRIEELYNTSKLPKRPNYDSINSLLIKMTEKFLYSPIIY